jgi:hypothetical protein
MIQSAHRYIASECVAVRAVVCGSALGNRIEWQCGSAVECVAVWGSAPVCAAVCGSVWQCAQECGTMTTLVCVLCARQCVLMCLVVCGSAHAQ